MKIAVFIVLAIHGIGLLALLMQGCKKEPETTPFESAEDTNAFPPQAFVEETNAPPPFTNPVDTTIATNIATTPEPVAPPPAVPPVATPTEHKVAPGDTYTSIARTYHTTIRALMDANPGVDPTKLQIGQTLHIPSPSPTEPPRNGTATVPGAGLDTGERIYLVQSGDNLIKIAGKFNVTLKALRSANNLTTDRIKVGQKLKIPVKAPAAPTTSTGATTVPTP